MFGTRERTGMLQGSRALVRAQIPIRDYTKKLIEHLFVIDQSTPDVFTIDLITEPSRTSRFGSRHHFRPRKRREYLA